MDYHVNDCALKIAKQISSNPIDIKNIEAIAVTCIVEMLDDVNLEHIAGETQRESMEGEDD